MTDFFKHIRWYLAGKWGRKRRVLAGPDSDVSWVDSDALPYVAINSHAVAFSGRTLLGLNECNRIGFLLSEIARLRRNKKKHSHLQKELDALINGCTDNGVS